MDSDSSHNARDFSRRESEVFRLLLEGMSNRKIAATLKIAPKTVEEHLTSIYAKLGVTSRAEAIVWGIRQSRDFPH